MNEFEMGKVAAFNALVDMAEDGATVADLVEAAGQELTDEEVKIASVEERDYRLGIENVCHDIYVKVAELYGNYDTEDLDETELVDAVLTAIRPDVDEETEKTASDEDFYNNVVEYLNENLTEDDIEKVAEVILDNVFELPLEKDASDEEVEYYNSAVDFLNEFDEESQEKIAEVILDNVDEEYLEELAKEAAKPKMSTRFENFMRGGKARRKIRNKMSDVAFDVKKNPGKAALVGAGAIGAGVGAKKLMDKRKAAKESEKQASDDKLVQAYDLLREAGLLDD